MKQEGKQKKYKLLETDSSKTKNTGFLREFSSTFSSLTTGILISSLRN